MKVFKITTRDDRLPAFVEAYYYKEDGSFVNFYIERSDHDELVASFNKMSITSVVVIAECVSRRYYELTGEVGYKYTGTDPGGEDAKVVERLND